MQICKTEAGRLNTCKKYYRQQTEFQFCSQLFNSTHIFIRCHIIFPLVGSWLFTICFSYNSSYTLFEVTFNGLAHQNIENKLIHFL